MTHEQYVVIEWNNGPVAVEKFVSDEPITLDVAVAHYERDGANFERDSITLVDPPETINLSLPTDMAFLVMNNDPNREVIAVVPGLAGTVGRPDHATCYAHIGQHGTCSIDGITVMRENATPDEYAELKGELESVGYNINVIPKSRIGNMKYTDMRRKELGL